MIPLQSLKSNKIKTKYQFVVKLKKAVIRSEPIATTDKTKHEINRELGLEGDDITERVPNFFGVGHD
jgi:hypothetical protein